MHTECEQTVYWHRELPPFDAEPMGEHVLEAVSEHALMTSAHRDEIWGRCYQSLMARATERLSEEIRRLGGDYAHVISESIDTRHDDATGETWLHGLFTYTLLRRTAEPAMARSGVLHG